MYSVALLALLALGAALVVRGLRGKSRAAIAAGLGVVALTLAVFGFFSFWGEMLWFAEVGFLERFWTVVGAKVGLASISALFAAVLVATITLPARRVGRLPRKIGIAFAAVMGGMWGAANWSVILRWAMGVSTEL